MNLHTARAALLILFISPICAAKNWTLDEALNRALEANPDASIAQASVDRAQAIAQQADSTLYPRISANLGYSQTDNPMMSFGNILNQGTFDNTINFNDPGRTDAFSAGVYLKYPIFTGGTAAAKRRSAENISDAAVLEREVAYNNLRMETIRSYFAIIQAKLLRKSILRTLDSLEENLRNAKALENEGKILKSERLNIEVRLLSAKQALLTAEHQLALSKTRFSNLLALDGGDDADADESVFKVACFKIPEEKEGRVRPEVSALEMRVESSKNNVDAQVGLYFPMVSIIGGYQYDKGWVRSGDNGSWNAGVVMEIPIFDGMLTRGKVMEAKSLETQMRQMLRKLELDLNYQKQSALLSEKNIREQTELAKAQVAQADESLKILSARFKEGAAMSVELLRAESAAAEARIKLDILRCSKNVAAAELRRSMGLDILGK